MPGAMMFNREVAFCVDAYTGAPSTYAGQDTGKTFVQLCLDTLPEVGFEQQEIEVTSTCSTGAEYIAGIPEGTRFSVTGIFRGGDATDFGVGASTLPGLCEAKAIIAIKDSSPQFTGPMIMRFNVTCLSFKMLGGGVKDVQKFMFEGRITNGISRAAA